MDGIVAVKVGGAYVYLTEDGRHAFVGSLGNDGKHSSVRSALTTRGRGKRADT